jgi:hypothetical protein
MKKTWPLFIILSLLLASCNFPLIQPADNSAAAIATQVASVLTSTAQANIPESGDQNNGDQTSVTQEPKPEGGLVTETIQPTATVTPTLTATITNDPATSLGSPVWSNSLDNGNAFGLSGSGDTNDFYALYVQGGYMVFNAYSANGYHTWRLTPGSLTNYYLEGEFLTGNCSGSDQYGLVTRASDYGSGYGYYFAITCDGRYALQQMDGSGLSAVTDWTTSTYLISGSNQRNRIGIWMNGNSIKLYINGNMVREVTDDSFTSGNIFGAFFAAYNNSGFTVSLDTIRQWNLP